MNESMSSRLAGVAREIEARQDVTDATQRIVEAAVDMVGEGTVSSAISLVHGRQRVETVYASSDLARSGDDLQYQFGQGPCLDAIWEHEQVHAGDLANDTRWPRWGKKVANDYGVQAMLCSRLFTSDNLVGALNIYSRDRYAFDQEARETARLLATHAAIAVAAAQQVEQLELAVDHRTTIGKAIGVLMSRYNLDDDGAMAVLRRYSSHENRKLFTIAQDILDDQRNNAAKTDHK